MAEALWRIEQRRRERDRARLLALLDAAEAVTEEPPSAARLAALRRARAAYDVPALRREVAYDNEHAAAEQAAAAAAAKRVAGFDELPDAPANLMCGAMVARAAGRWTDFGQCSRAARRVVRIKPRRPTEPVELAVCVPHAKQELAQPGRVARWIPERRVLNAGRGTPVSSR